MADRSLPAEIKEKIDATVHNMEKEEGQDFAAPYLSLLERLEHKYHIA